MSVAIVKWRIGGQNVCHFLMPQHLLSCQTVEARIDDVLMQSCTSASVECRLTRPERQFPSEVSHGLAGAVASVGDMPQQASTGMTTPPREPIFVVIYVLNRRTNHAKEGQEGRPSVAEYTKVL